MTLKEGFIPEDSIFQLHFSSLASDPSFDSNQRLKKKVNIFEEGSTFRGRMLYFRLDRDRLSPCDAVRKR
jgi:hypothetical protein